MKLRRRYILFYVIVISLITIFIASLSYDKYSRNKSINNFNKYLIEQYLSNDEKQYLIDNNIDVDIFIKYIKEVNFNLYNYQYYELINRYFSDKSINYIVENANFFVKDQFTLNGLNTIFSEKIYDVDQLIYLSNFNTKFKVNINYYPNKLNSLANYNNYIYNYIPNDLVSLDKDITNDKDIKVRKEVKEQLDIMCNNLNLITNKKCGGMIVSKGYVSYDNLDNINDRYNINIRNSYLYAGISDFQLGLSIEFNNNDNFDNNFLYLWLINNSYKYGFIQRYPIDKLESTHITNMNATFRYVGINDATKIKNSNLSLEEYVNKGDK